MSQDVQRTDSSPVAAKPLGALRTFLASDIVYSLSLIHI